MRGTSALTLLTDDPVARIDVPVLAQARGWTVRIEDVEDHFVFHMVDDRSSDMNAPR